LSKITQNKANFHFWGAAAFGTFLPFAALAKSCLIARDFGWYCGGPSFVLVHSNTINIEEADIQSSIA